MDHFVRSIATYTRVVARIFPFLPNPPREHFFQDLSSEHMGLSASNATFLILKYSRNLKKIHETSVHIIADDVIVILIKITYWIFHF